MNVLKEGNSQMRIDTFIAQVDCSKCGARLEVLGEDLFIGGEPGNYCAHVECPHCQEWIVVEVPGNLLSELPNERTWRRGTAAVKLTAPGALLNGRGKLTPAAAVLMHVQLLIASGFNHAEDTFEVDLVAASQTLLCPHMAACRDRKIIDEVVRRLSKTFWIVTVEEDADQVPCLLRVAANKERLRQDGHRV